jgi:competence protein ComEA
MRDASFGNIWVVLILIAGIALAGCMGPGAGTAGEKVNINSADAKALDGLPGIGPKLAADIVAYRKANGPFKAVDDLAKIDGLGKKTLEKVRPLVTVGR